MERKGGEPHRLRQLIALLLVLLIVGLTGLFSWFAYALRLDFRDRFRRIGHQLADDAMKVMRDVFSRHGPGGSDSN